MNKKQSLKQQYILIILFMIGNYMLVESLFSKNLKDKIQNAQTRSKELVEESNFISGRLPKETFDVKALEKEIAKLTKRNNQLKKSLYGMNEASQTPAVRLNQLNINAQDLNINISKSVTNIDEQETVYKIEFISTFQQLLNFIQRSHEKPGEISIKQISFKNTQGLLKTNLEFSL